MKKKLTTPGLVICWIAVLMSCEKEFQITPVPGKGQSAVTKSDDDAVARKITDASNSLTSAVNGNIDGRSFTGNMTITEFVENDGVLYAQAQLSDVKITGKDHKYLEYILEREPYSVPVAIGDMAQSASTNQVAAAAAACSVLTLNFEGVNTDIVGLMVHIDPVSVTIDAGDNEVLGNLICTVFDTLNNVVDLVGLLNQILGLLSL